MFRNRRFGSDRGRSFAPINVGDELDVTIEAQGEKGDGLAKIKGFVIFVPGVKQGERVKIKINKVLKKVGFGEVVGKATTEESPEETTESTEEPQEDSGEQESTEETEDSTEEPAEEDSSEESTEEPSEEGSTEESKEEPAEDSEDFGEEEKK